MASKLILITVFVFNLIAFGLAVAAEQRKSTAHTEFTNQDQNYTHCVYDSDISTGYGVGAFLFLLASQLLITFASRCFCCGKAMNPGGSRACALILFVLCWVTFLVAESCLLAGSVRNAYHTSYAMPFFKDGTLHCATLRKGVFAAGAAFVFLTGLISEFYYISYSKAQKGFAGYGGEAGVGLGTYNK